MQESLMEDQDTQSMEIKKYTKQLLENWRVIHVMESVSNDLEPYFYLVGSVNRISSDQPYVARTQKLLHIGTWSKNRNYWIIQSAPNTHRNPDSVTNEYYLLPKDGQDRMDPLLMTMMKTDVLHLEAQEIKYQWLRIKKEGSEFEFKIRTKNELQL